MDAPSTRAALDALRAAPTLLAGLALVDDLARAARGEGVRHWLRRAATG